MRNLFLLVVLASFVTGLAFAGTPHTDPSVTLVTRVWSERLLSNGKVPYHHPIVYNGLTLQWKNGVYVNPELYSNANDLSFDDSPGDNLELTLGWSGNCGRLKIDAAVQWVSPRPIFEVQKGDFVDYQLEVGYPIVVSRRHTLTPFAKVDVCRFQQKPQLDGTMYRFGVKDEWKLGKNVAISQALFVSHTDEGLGGLHEGYDAQYWFETKWARGKHNTLILPAIKVNVPLEDLRDGRREEIVLGFGWKIRL